MVLGTEHLHPPAAVVADPMKQRLATMGAASAQPRWQLVDHPVRLAPALVKDAGGVDGDLAACRTIRFNMR